MAIVYIEMKVGMVAAYELAEGKYIYKLDISALYGAVRYTVYTDTVHVSDIDTFSSDAILASVQKFTKHHNKGLVKRGRA